MIREFTAAKFYHVWLKKAFAERENIDRLWDDYVGLTQLVLRNETCILKQVADDLGLNCYSRSDYYHIDGVLYKDEDKVPGLPENWCWLRAIRVAFEHENFFKRGLFTEVAHLLITNCEVRVLVTYPTGNRLLDEAELQKLHEIISGAPNARIIADEESFLLILGHWDGHHWEGHVFKTEGWRRIQIE